MQKNIQISMELFNKLLTYHLINDEIDLDLGEEIGRDLLKKLDTFIDRQLYSTYKTAPTEQEREKARQKYLDRRGFHRDFRWSEEYDKNR